VSLCALGVPCGFLEWWLKAIPEGAEDAEDRVLGDAERA
jgi:hypothetical protein